MPGHDLPGLDIPGAEGERTRAFVAEIAEAALAPDLRAGLQRTARALRLSFNADHAAIFMTPRRFQASSAADSVFADQAWVDRWANTPDFGYTRAAEEDRSPLVEDLSLLPPGPARDDLLNHGMRSAIWLRLLDERGETIGVVGVAAARTAAFAPEQMEGLRRVVPVISGFVRRGMLAEHLRAERALLAHEARLLALASTSETEPQLATGAVQVVREALGADAVALVAVPGEGVPRVLATTSSGPPLREQAAGKGPLDSRALLRLVPDGGYSNQDIALAGAEAAETVVHRLFGFRSVVAARSDAAGVGPFFVAAASLQPNAWGRLERDFLTRTAAVIDLSLRRLLEEASSRERAARVSELTHLLGALSASASPEEAARLFAARVRSLLRADTVLIHAFDQEQGLRREVAFDGDRALDVLSGSLPLSQSRIYRETLHTPAALYDAGVQGNVPGWVLEGAREHGIGSLVAVRLDGSDGPAGILVAAARQPGAFGETDVETLAEVATPLAMVIDRASMLASLQRQTQRATAVMDILTALGPSESIEAAAVPLARALRAMWDADHCLLGLVDGDFVAVAGYDSSLDLTWLPGGYRLDALSTTRTAAVAGYDVVFDYQHELARTGPMVEGLRRAGLRSSMRVLLGDPDAPVGLLTVGSCEPNRFTEKDAQDLRQIMQPLAVAAGYFRNLREAERRNRQLEYTNRILSRLSAGSIVAELATAFLAECRAHFGCERSAILRIDPEAATAAVLAFDPAEDFPNEAAAALPLANLDPGPEACAQDPQVVADLRTLDARGALHDQAVAQGFFSFLRVPIAHGEQTCGAVVLWGEGPGRFDDDDARLLAALTHPLAIALERAQALAALAESETKYRSLVTQAEEMIFIVDAATRRIVDANAYTSRALGYTAEELLALRLDDLCVMTEEFIDANVRHILAEGEIRLSEHEYRRKDASTVMVDIVATRSSFAGRDALLVLARDITEVRGFQRQLMQAQKMESLGTMAGAVAHDFNNLLTTILGFAGLLKRSPHLDNEDRENLALIEDASRHAADLTGRLLAFARGGLVRFGPVDLRDAITDTLRLAEPALQSRVTLTVDLPGDPVTVEGDQGQLQQALINIVLNARDAMPEGGAIHVSLHADHAVATINIADNGPGMDEETRTRIFEPFYTTKPPGSGTGLGMAITYGIVQGHHGTVTVDSGPGSGTTFSITLPLLPAGATHRSDDAFSAGDGDLIMVVDDDQRVRRAVHAMLADLGYNVVEARDGPTAIQLLRARPERFAAVLLDLVMPGMNGSETFYGLEAIRPGLPVIVCTAYAADAHIDTEVKRRIAGLIQKPFTKERLERALAGILPR